MEGENMNTTANYRIKLRTGRSAPTGMYTITKEGTKKVVTEYRENFVTPSGTFSPKEWREKAMAAVKADGKEELLKRIRLYCGQHCAWLRTEDDVEVHALDCLCSEAYKSWEEFKEET